MNSNKIFDISGRSFKAEGNSPFLINIPDKVWVIMSGSVDLFSVKIINGKPAGTRKHMFRTEQGQVILGFNPAPGDMETGFLAVGTSGTLLMEIEKALFFRLAGHSEHARTFEDLTASWIKNLTSSISEKKLFQKHITFLDDIPELTMTGSENIGTRHSLVWVRHHAGAGLFMGIDNLPTIPESIYFPLVKNTWHKMGGQGLLTMTEHQDFINDSQFSTSLDIYHDFILTCASLNQKIIEEASQFRLRQRKKFDRKTFSHALAGLASIFDKKSELEINKTSSDEPLFAAAKMVGNVLDIFILRPKSSKNVTLEDIARVSRFRTREVLLRQGWFNSDNGPLLAFLEKNNQPVALIRNSSGRYELYDPVTNEQIRINNKIDKKLNPKAFSFYRPFPEKALTGKDLIKFGLKGMSQDRTMILLMGTCGGLLGLLSPVMTGYIFDTLIPEASRGRLLQIAGILIAVAISTAMFDITKSFALLRIEGKMDSVIQSALWDRLLALPVSFFKKYSAGDLAVRSMGINTIRAILSGVTISAILGCIFSTFNLALLFYYNKNLAILAIVLSLIGITVSLLAGFFQTRLQKDIMEIEGKNSGLLLQFITGISKLRVSGTEDRAFAVWAGHFTRKKALAFRTGVIQNFQATFNSMFTVFTSMSIFAWIIFKGAEDLTTGQFIAFISAYGTFQGALLEMVNAVTACLTIIPLYNRAKPIFSALPESDESKTIPESLSGDIEINHLNFRYDSDGPNVINDVSLKISPGEFVAIVGGSGSGKSTLLRLLLGFETPDSGTIYYDGQDLSSLDISEVRRNIGVVLQNGILMPGDIFKNIVGVSNLTLDNAWEAAQMVGIKNDIKEMPMGMHTMLSAGGGTLSGGQRQRLLIARAIVKRPRILFFDEATSALDNKTQAIVSQSLEGLNSARMVIAHRLSTIKNADRIYVLDHGIIVESGTYNDLMDKAGIFAKMTLRQIA